MLASTTKTRARKSGRLTRITAIRITQDRSQRANGEETSANRFTLCHVVGAADGS